MRRITIVCEGYHDRSFWSGWLLSLGCRDARPRPGAPVPDPHTGRTVTGGRFAFKTSGGDWVSVVPAGGDKTQVVRLIGREVQEAGRIRQVDAVEIIASMDADVPVGTRIPYGKRCQAILGHVPSLTVDTRAAANTTLVSQDGLVRVHIVLWWSKSGPMRGVPEKQCLERLVCAAIASARSSCAADVATWLASRSHPPKPSAAEFAWSYMAGWYAEHDCDDFWRVPWREKDLKTALEEQLTVIGAIPLIQNLIRGGPDI